MRRQTAVGIAIAIAIGALVAWIARNTYWDEITIPMPLQGEAARNPFYVAGRLVEELGATSEWRRTLGEMPEPNAALVLMHWHWGVFDSRRARLEGWVESGGRLVLVGNVSGSQGALREWIGLSKDYADDLADAEDADYEPQTAVPPPYVIGPGRPCGTLRVAAGRSSANPSRTRYSVCGLDMGRLTSAREAEWALANEPGEADGVPQEGAWLQAVRVPAGEGSVTWINAASYDVEQPFSNLVLLENDHGVLFVDALQLHHGDHVVFVSAEERASLLELIWTYGAPAVFLSLALAGLALWRNTARFGPLTASLDLARRSLAEQIRGTARFALRVGHGMSLHRAMVRAVNEAARRHIPGYERMNGSDRVSAISRLADVDADRLAGAMLSGRQHSMNEFRTAVALLDAVRRNLTKTPREERRK